MPSGCASTVELPADQRAPSEARDFVRRSACGDHAPELVDEALLLVSEVVTNAVRHGTPPVTLEMICLGDDGLELRISDGSPERPRSKDFTDDGEGGRGLFLVDTISDAWGVEPGESGKQVWFRLHLPRA